MQADCFWPRAVLRLSHSGDTESPAAPVDHRTETAVPIGNSHFMFTEQATNPNTDSTGSSDVSETRNGVAYSARPDRRLGIVGGPAPRSTARFYSLTGQCCLGFRVVGGAAQRFGDDGGDSSRLGDQGCVVDIVGVDAGIHALGHELLGFGVHHP